MTITRAARLLVMCVCAGLLVWVTYWLIGYWLLVWLAASVATGLVLGHVNYRSKNRQAQYFRERFPDSR